MSAVRKWFAKRDKHLNLRNVENNFDLEHDQFWFFQDFKREHVDVRNFLFGEPMNGQALDHRRLIRPGKKIRSNSLRSTSLLYKILPTNLGE